MPGAITIVAALIAALDTLGSEKLLFKVSSILVDVLEGEVRVPASSIVYVPAMASLALTLILVILAPSIAPGAL